MNPDLSKPLEEIVENFLVCPQTHKPLKVQDGRISCSESGFEGEIRDNVVLAVKTQSFFDDKFEIMQRGHDESEDEKRVFYLQQIEFLENFLKQHSKRVILDVGCGPSLPYHANGSSVVIGLEPSFPSIRVNKDVHLRVAGSAAEIPLEENSVDVVICFYSIHHIIGSSVRENKEGMKKVFSEFQRVVRKGGHVLVFETTPMFPFDMVQDLGWNGAKKILKNKLDMYFWPMKTIAKMGREQMPSAQLEEIFFKISWSQRLSPVFSLPWLKIPKLLYPFDLKLYKWNF